MKANPKIWQFIGAVIVLIAVQFAPALARAHTDQAHRLSVHVHVHHHASPHGMGAADASLALSFDRAALAQTIATVPHEQFLTASQAPNAAAIDADGCVHGCCGSGMGCCGGAALAATSQWLHPAVHSHRLDFASALLASGIEPASLRKPPRPLA